MIRSKIALLTVALAWCLFPVNAYSLPLYWYVTLIAKSETTPVTLEQDAHYLFRRGVTTGQPISYHDNVALTFYNALLDLHNGRNFWRLYPDRNVAVGVARRTTQRGGEYYPFNGLILEVAPDARAYNYVRTLNELRRVIPDQAGATHIQSILRNVITDTAPDTLVTAMPLPSDEAPISTIIQGTHIRRAFIYYADAQGREQHREVQRDVQQDGPFSEAHDEHVVQGYPFHPSPEPFIVDGTIVSVAPGTDNLTSAVGCEAPLSIPAPSHAFDRQVSLENKCVSEEMITLEAFNNRHFRHRVVPLFSSMFLLW